MPTPDMTLWTGRDDTPLEGPQALRVHQCVQAWTPVSSAGVALLGFACDEGVRRNSGRVGAAAGPAALRRALSNLAWTSEDRLHDAGDVVCRGRDLEVAQDELAERLVELNGRHQRVITLGGGHETAWGTFLGLARSAPGATVGIINLDAHFDLRPGPAAHSGTPFRQMANWCQAVHHPFRYLCLGIAGPNNTHALFQTATSLGVSWKFDHELAPWRLAPVWEQLRDFAARVDMLYMSLDLDVLPGSVMPAVSAPAAHGVPVETIEAVIQWIAGTGKLAAADVVEFNPTYDPDGTAARTAARLIWQLARYWTRAPQGVQ